MREQRKIRWRPCINKATTEIPPFSLVEISSGYFASESIGGQDVLLIRKPTGYTYNPALLAVTGPLTIPAASGSTPGHGQCTQDWPAMVAYEPSVSGVFSTGDTVGPSAGSFYPTTAASSFTVVGHVASRPLQDDAVVGSVPSALTAKTGQQCVWISPPGMVATRHLKIFVSEVSADSAEPFSLEDEGLTATRLTDSELAAIADNNLSICKLDEYPDKAACAIRIRTQGYYMYGFSASLNPGDSSAEDGDILRVGLRSVRDVWGWGGLHGGWQMHQGMRSYQRLQDYSGEYRGIFLENVAFSNILYIGEEPGSVASDTREDPFYLGIINMSAIEVDAVDFQFWIMPVGVIADSNTSVRGWAV